MLFIIYGEDSYRSKLKLSAIRKRFRDTRDSTGLNEACLRYPKNSLSDAQEAIFSSPFLADRKLILLENFISLPKADQREFVDLLAKKPDSSTVIFFEVESRDGMKDSPLFELLQSNSYSEEFKPLQGDQLTDFIASECASKGMTIDIRACAEIIQVIGSDSWLLHNEVSKICSLAHARKLDIITINLVNEILSGEKEESIFSFLDACMQGRTRESMTILEKFVYSSVNNLQLLTMLQRQLKNIIGAHDLLSRGVSDKNEVGRRLGVHPFPASKAMAIARGASRTKLELLLGELVDIERRFKNGTGNIVAEIGLFASRMGR